MADPNEVTVASLTPGGNAQGDDQRDFDMRNAVLLVDSERREFLADLDPLTVNSYAVLYARNAKWIAYAIREGRRAKEKNEADAEKWERLRERWQVSNAWLDRNLVMSGSIRGRRAQQLVDVLASSRDPPNLGGAQVVVPQIYQGEQAKPKKGIWSR